MPIEIKVDNPAFPKDTEFDVGGVLVQNGKSVKLSEEAELSFVSRHRKSVKDWAGDSEIVTVSGTSNYGPSEVSKMFPEPEPPQIVDEQVEPAATLVGVPEGSEN